VNPRGKIAGSGIGRAAGKMEGRPDRRIRAAFGKLQPCA
jgi:hypothetical protein